MASDEFGAGYFSGSSPDVSFVGTFSASWLRSAVLTGQGVRRVIGCDGSEPTAQVVRVVVAEIFSATIFLDYR